MKKTNRYIKMAIAACFMMTASVASAALPALQQVFACDTTAVGLKLTSVDMYRDGSKMVVDMGLNLEDTKMHGDRAIVYTPILVNGTDSMALKSIGLYGRTRWIQYQRDKENPLGGLGENSYKFSGRPMNLAYSESVKYEDWMNGAKLVVRRSDYGCCRRLLDRQNVDLAEWRELSYKPVLHWSRPVAGGPKVFEIEGEAFIDFPVDQTVIYPEYRNNKFELDSIKATIDVVRNDADATIKTVWLKGFASPESPYSHNTMLAKGRTAALKDYIQKLYHFEGVEILTDYEPEDWAGLRKAVENGNLEHRTEILALIDSDMAPDPKEWKIKTTYPAEYKYMLENYYPPLRHTNYKVVYDVRSYTDPQEILEVMKTRPGNLSLDEFYLAASVLEPGSDEYNRVFETAVFVHPTSEIANLNAANAAIQRDDMVAAQRYLAFAGDNADANYTRSVVATMNGSFSLADDYLNRALAQGLQIDAAELKQLQEVINYGKSKN